MLWFAIISMFVASVILAIGICFVKKSKLFYLLLNMLSLIALVCLGVSCACYANDFSGYSIVLILSVIPLFLGLPSEVFISPNTNGNEKKSYFSQYGEMIIKGIACTLTAICITFASLYLGKESIFSPFVGVGIGLALTFLDLIIQRKNINGGFKGYIWAFLGRFFIFLSVGLSLSAIIPTMLYSIVLSNILFSLGALAFAIYGFLTIYLKSKFDHFAYFIATFLLLSTIIF